MSYLINEIKGKDEMLAALSLLNQLQKDLTQNEMKDCLALMLPMGYRMFGVYDKNELIGLTGIWTGAKFYCGKYMEIDNFVIHENYRSAGVGKQLTDFVVELAKKEKCKVVMLDAYTVNEPAHKFYLREGFEIKGYHFIKYL